MQAAFGTVIWIVCGASIVVAVVALVTGRRAWSEYGRDRLLLDRDAPAAPGHGSVAAMAEREDEIRQLLEARNARRIRRGEVPLDIEQELARLTAPVVDSGLRAEIRDLVIARNHRRAQRGQPPLDVEAEVERQIADLSGL